jgi:hypothetical protein
MSDDSDYKGMRLSNSPATIAPPTGVLWVVTLGFSVLLLFGTLIAYDKGAAQMFGVLGAVSIPVISFLHWIN